MCQLILRSADSNFGTNVLLLDHSSDLPQQTISERMLELYNQLMDNIAANHRKTGEVRFYADALNVTPRYLAQITRRVAGRTPKQLIDDYIIKEVETYLIGTTQNIQEIAFTFGFSSQVQFNKFLKNERLCTRTIQKKSKKCGGVETETSRCLLTIAKLCFFSFSEKTEYFAHSVLSYFLVLHKLK